MKQNGVGVRPPCGMGLDTFRRVTQIGKQERRTGDSFSLWNEEGRERKDQESVWGYVREEPLCSLRALVGFHYSLGAMCGVQICRYTSYPLRITGNLGTPVK